MDVQFGGSGYWLSKQAYCDYFNDLLVFDELSSSFYITSYYINSLLEVKDGKARFLEEDKVYSEI